MSATGSDHVADGMQRGAPGVGPTAAEGGTSAGGGFASATDHTGTGAQVAGEVGGLMLSAAATEQLSRCVHCGFCLPACPTYRELGEEADSPRGRIDMVGAAYRGEVALADPDLALHIERCLDCRACESACPSGVQYHLLFEAAMGALPPGGPRGAADGRGAWDPALQAGATPGWLRVALRHLVRQPRLLAWMAARPERWPGLARRLPRPVAALAAGLPAGGKGPARYRLPPLLAARGPRRGTVDLFLGCVQDACFGDDNLAMAGVLRAWGYDVHLAPAQTCCGALQSHTGDAAAVRQLGQRNVRAFAGERPVVVAAAGCSALLREYGRLFGDTGFADGARSLARRVTDFSAFLAEVPRAQRPVPLPPSGAPVRLTYHDPCHLSHAQGVRRQPRELLAALPGVHYVELPEADACCGSAGVYNLTQPELAGRVLARKVDHIRATGAEWVVTANPGCVLQLRAGLRAAELNVRVLSLAEVLGAAYEQGTAQTAAGAEADVPAGW